MSLADRSQKTSGIKILTQVGFDPDADRYTKLKEEEEKLRQAIRAKPTVKPKRSRESGANANASYRDHDEGSDDEGGISIAAIKNKYKKGNQKQSAAQIYSDSDDGSEGSDLDVRRRKKVDKAKALKDSDDDESGSQHSDKHSGDEDEKGSGTENSAHSDED
jgi:RNA polymerase-associated protein LEO1